MKRPRSLETLRRLRLLGGSSFLGLLSVCALLGAGCGASGAPPAQVTASASKSDASSSDAAKGLTNEAETWPGLETSAPGRPARPGASEPADPPRSAPPLAEKPTRIYVREGFQNILLKPDWDAPVIGMMRAGQSVGLKSEEPLSGDGVSRCAGGWFAIEPRGFVCVGWASTLDGRDPRVLAARTVLPDRSSPTGFHVGVSIGAPLYLRIPTAAEQREAEPGLGGHLARLPPPDDALGAIDASPAGAPPSEALKAYFASEKPPLVADQAAYDGMKVAWAEQFDAEGRTWLVTPELGLLPKDKVRVARVPDLKGVWLGEKSGVTLPLAFTWLADAPKLHLDASGQAVETGERFGRHQFIQVTGVLKKTKTGMVLPTRGKDYVGFDQVTLIRPADERPRGVGPTDKWVSVSVTRGFLLAYEGDKPVFVSAISPGADGLGPRGYVTPPGQHFVYSKALTWDMAGITRGDPWKVEEVPRVAFYDDNYAVHGAWWHDEFGRPKSHGCVNVPPSAMLELFDWLDPELPEGWFVAGAYYPQVKGTVVVVGP